MAQGVDWWSLEGSWNKLSRSDNDPARKSRFALPMELVRAARASALSAWHPVPSHNYLRLYDGLAFCPEPPEVVHEAPGGIKYFVYDDDPRPLYEVFSGVLFATPDPVVVLATYDAQEAVAALVRIVEDNPAHRWGT
ncbi:hypothetical protein ABT160_30025 [Streptomyces sp. NPDC001941]|uniref:hypothetical protein n=1 Tax=Streptomyces sp. NPDC001941 TaxID=3154659 RepID=UPI0033275A90